MTPQPRLPSKIGIKYGGVGAQGRMRVNNRSRQTVVQLGVCFGGVDLSQQHLTVRPRKFKRPFFQVPVLVFVHQRFAGGSGFADAVNQVNGRRLVWFDADSVPNGNDGVQHGSLIARQHIHFHRLRSGQGFAPTDKLAAVSFKSYLFRGGAVHIHQVKHPRGPFVVRARSARAENRFVVGDDFSLYKKIAEGRMGFVRSLTCQYDFGITRYFQDLYRLRTVGDAHPSHLGIIFGRNHNLGFSIYSIILSAEFSMTQRKQRLIIFSRLEGRLMGI